MAELLLHGVTFAAPADGDGELPELTFERARIQVQMIAGADVDATDGSVELEGFYFLFDEVGPDGDPLPNSVRVRVPCEAETARLVASTILDALEKARVVKAPVSVAGAHELGVLEQRRQRDLGHLNRAGRRRK